VFLAIALSGSTRLGDGESADRFAQRSRAHEGLVVEHATVL